MKNRGFGPAANVEIIPRKEKWKFEKVSFNIVGIDVNDTPSKKSKTLWAPDNSRGKTNKVEDFLPISFDISYIDLLGRPFKLKANYLEKEKEEILFQEGFEFINSKQDHVRV